jgi:hypothetical protein
MCSKKTEQPSEEKTEVEKYEEAIKGYEANAELYAKAILEGTVKSFTVIDQMTSSKLKQVLKCIIAYPHTAKNFKEHKIIPKEEMTKLQEQIYDYAVATKDMYAELINCMKQAELLQKRLGELKGEETDE